jgi:hypothetical protein
MRRAVGVLVVAFLAAAGAAFVASLLRRHPPEREIGYQLPVSPDGPQASVG